MKRFNTIFSKVFSVICVMGFCYVPDISAEKMELANDTVKIYGVGQQSKEDTVFRIKDSFKNADKIRITELCLTYEGSGNKASLLSIVEIDGDTLYSNDVKNGLMPGELQKYVRLYLSMDKSYKITHGEKDWMVSFASENTENAETADALASENPNDIAENTGDNTKYYIPLWIYFIIGLLVIACIILLLPKIKKVLSRKEEEELNPEQPEKPSHNSPLTPGDVSDSPVGGSIETEADDAGKEPSELDVLKGKIDSLLPNNNDKNLSYEEKIEQIKSSLDSGKNAIDGLDSVRQALGIKDGNVGPNSLCEKINELKNSSLTVSPDTKRKECDTLIEELNKKKDKILSDVLAKAKKEKKDSYDIILKVIVLLLSKVGDEKTTTGEPSIKITDEQLKSSDNSYTLKKWFFEKFNAAGISIDKNKTILENLNELSSRLNKLQEETPRKSDEEIVDGIILEEKLTEGQKKILIRRLVKSINKKINDSSKHISDSISLADFVQSVADALQQPSTLEEAQEQVQQRNIAIVSEALKKDMKSLSKDTIKEAVDNIILGILQSNLSNVSTDSYAGALESLKTYNNRYEKSEKLLKDFNVGSLSDLPNAIRKKQDSELIKSVSKDVAELLPKQNIESPHGLINALCREVKEAKDSCILIADDLEEKISLRDKDFTSSEENRDVRKLMGRYDKLVAEEKDGLNRQITSKNNEISQLKKENTNKESTITSLKEDKQNLMSASKILVGNLHDGADKILESCNKTILKPCSDNEEEQCMSIEESIFSELKASVERMTSFKVDENTIPSDTRKKIQELLIDEIKKEKSVVNTVCRYYAYSRLPFMTDTSRGCGITFNRKNMSELYNAIENLYVQFGINLNVPSLFVMGVEEGDFENVTGKMFGDLDNLCPNSRNHFDKIDSATKPSNVVVDVVNIGYSVDGIEGRKTSVLTY